MVSRAGQPELALKSYSVVIILFCVLAALVLTGCGGGGSTGGGSTPTPTPTPTVTPSPTPVPTPTPLPAGAIEFKVLDSTVPPNGIYQYQLSTTEPKPIGAGSTRPTVPTGPVGPVRGTAVNDPSGLAAGIAVINGSNIAVQLVGPNLGSTLGTNIAYPLLTISMPVVNTATPGQTFNANFDVANSSFFDASQTPYTLVPPTGPGVLTIGAAGTPYVSDVVPAGGVLPDRQVVRILGNNFTASTRVAIEGTTIFGPPTTDTTLVSPTEIDVVLCNGTVSATATSCPMTGATFRLDGERVRVKDSSFTPTTQIDYYSYQRADDVAGTSSNALVALVHPMYASQTTYLTATIPLVQTATQFTGLSLQNTSGVDDGIKIELLDVGNVSLVPAVTFILPGMTGTATAGKKITRDVIADWFGGTVPAGAAKVRMTVTSGNAPIQMLGMLGDTGTGVVKPVIPQ